MHGPRLAGCVSLAVGAVAAALFLWSHPADAQALNAHQALLRAIYQEMVEIDTTDSAGDNTRAAEAVAGRLRGAGIDARVIVPPGNARKGNVVARLPGRGTYRPILLLGHLDVVEARREDWQRDPFTLVEEGGYFYGRGALDDKAMSSILVANLVRLKQEGFVPDRDLIVALTADEERGGDSAFNGVEYLLAHHRALIDAEFALNEGGGGQVDASGKPLFVTVQHAEKTYQNFRLEVTNRGGHSSVPRRDNAIYTLVDALGRIGRFEFPFKMSELTRQFFMRIAKVEAPQLAEDLLDITGPAPNPAALLRVTAEPRLNVQVRTTCVATMLDGGHAENALPQRARAVVNCRVLPSDSIDEVRRTLERVVNDKTVTITPTGNTVASPESPIRGDVMRAAEAVAGQLWPGIPVVPTMSAGGTDGRFLRVAGIPTYGVSGILSDPDGNGTHGLDERVRVKSLYDGQEFLYRLLKSLSGG